MLLWLPADLVAHGYSMALSSKLLAESALIAFPTIFVVAFLYSRWSAKWSVVGAIFVSLVGLFGVVWLEIGHSGSPVLPVALLIVGFPLRIRGRTTGIVAACTKAGGVVAQFLAIIALVPTMAVVSLALIAPTIAAMALVAWFGTETRGSDLRDLDPDGRTFAATGM